MGAQIFGQMIRCVAVPVAMAGHDDSAPRRDSLRDPLIKTGVFVRPLSPFPRLVLMGKVMKEVMGIVGPDLML